MIKKTKFYSWNINKLPKGCQYCVKGEKLVMFVTGLCSRNCFYCPLSDTRKNKDRVWANEWPITNEKDIITEAELCDSKGAGITGGDPLLRLERTVKLIKQLKKRFGKKFHIHLYTLPESITKSRLEKLYKAGLDEIRLHPNLFNKKHWEKIELIKNFDWDIGIEIPVIPRNEKAIRELIDYFTPNIKFLNLNELEMSDTNSNQLLKLGYRCKNNLSYAIKGSEELAFKLLKYINQKYPRLNTHYCTAQLKDKAQLSNRIKRRAKNARKPYDKMLEDGILVRGVVYGKDLPRLRLKLMKRYKIPKNMIDIDKRKLRLLTSVNIVKRIKEKGLQREIVNEYPTYDQTEVMAEVL